MTSLVFHLLAWLKLQEQHALGEGAGQEALPLRLQSGLRPEPSRDLCAWAVLSADERLEEMMMYEKWPCATIFEDDVGLAENFSGRIAAVVATRAEHGCLLFIVRLYISSGSDVCKYTAC